MGNAGKADAVVVFDLSKRREIDRLYCYEPRRISENWIVYVEYYPAHSTGEPTDVVLLYDLDKGPLENRAERHSGITVQPNPSIAPNHVGIPVFPELNASQRSYSNFVPDPSLAHHVLGPPFFAFLPSKRLVFISTDGTDARDYHNYLVAVDLSKGPSNVSSHPIEIPRFHLKRLGANPQMVRVEKIEAVSPSAVRLYVSAQEYGVSSFLVEGIE